MSQRFGDVSVQSLKLAYFSDPAPYSAGSHGGDPLSNLCDIFTSWNWSPWITVSWKPHHHRFSCFNKILKRDGQTNRQTERQTDNTRWHGPRYAEHRMINPLTPTVAIWVQL